MKLYIALYSLLFLGGFFNTGFAECKGERQNAEVKSILQKVSQWQIKNFSYSKDKNLHDYGIDSWTNAVLYLGMLEWAKIAPDDSVYRWLDKIGNENNWQIPSNFKDYPKYQLYHADELCIAQFYLNMYDVYKDEKMVKAAKERVDWIIHNIPDKSMNFKNKQVWTWCDALFMAPPVYTHLYSITGDTVYLKYGDRQFKNTYNHLYDKEEKLFFRDDSYFNKREQNGEKIFWGRGNGWVIAGIVNILKQLPADSPYRPFYRKLYCELASELVSLQGRDGFWYASLLDPGSYPSPETSATALITYALAYGINNELLDKEYYLSITEKAWDALVSSVDQEGKLGWVQPIGADPKKVTKEMTAVYGVGAFLLAGTEMYKLTSIKSK